MIIMNILESIQNLVFSLITFTIPTINNDILTSFNTFLGYLDSGVNILQFFIPPFATIIITLILGIKLAVDLYFFVMWIIKKIPMLDIH